MKFFSTLFSVLAISGLIAQKEITTDSKIKDVTVFLSGAEVHRTAKVNLGQGSNIITFGDLSEFLNANSIQVKAKNSNVTVVSVNSQYNYLTEKNDSKRLIEVKDSIEDLDFSKAIRISHQTVYQEEKSLLLANKSIKGEQTGVDFEDLLDMADLYRERLLEIETKLLDIRLQLKNINESLTRLNNQKNILLKGSSKNTQEVIVNASAAQSGYVEFEISYVISRASWIPRYDIRSKDISGPVDLTYKADVYNLSGYDWENVNITLSSGNPSIDNTQPQLYPWNLKYYEKQKRSSNKNVSYAYGSGAKGRKAAAPVWNSNTEESDDLDLKLEAGNTLASFTDMVESSVTTEFKINLPYTIKSDGKPYLVEIQQYELPVEYSYVTTPKKDVDAFLLARISGWGSYNLLPGDANVYFEGTFVGSSYMETASTNDTLDISLGRDKGIVVKRTKVDEFCKNSTLGGTHKTARGYEILVRNNKSTAIDINIKDQIPLSSYKEVEVELNDQGGADYFEQSGFMDWKLKIAPGETKKVTYKFTVKYPKNSVLNNL